MKDTPMGKVRNIKVKNSRKFGKASSSWLYSTYEADRWQVQSYAICRCL